MIATSQLPVGTAYRTHCRKNRQMLPNIKKILFFYYQISHQSNLNNCHQHQSHQNNFHLEQLVRNSNQQSDRI